MIWFLTSATKKLNDSQGTDEFMSIGLLRAYPDDDYLQSPVDDLWSFYYVAQWAAAYNGFQQDDDIPHGLKIFREKIRGSLHERDSATLHVLHSRIEDSSEYGTFLSECSTILRKWSIKLTELQLEWRKTLGNLRQTQVEGNLYGVYYPHFRELTDKGVLDLLELIAEHFFDGNTR